MITEIVKGKFFSQYNLTWSKFRRRFVNLSLEAYYNLKFFSALGQGLPVATDQSTVTNPVAIEITKETEIEIEIIIADILNEIEICIILKLITTTLLIIIIITNIMKIFVVPIQLPMLNFAENTTLSLSMGLSKERIRKIEEAFIPVVALQMKTIRIGNWKIFFISGNIFLGGIFLV